MLVCSLEENILALKYVTIYVINMSFVRLLSRPDWYEMTKCSRDYDGIVLPGT